MLRTTHKHPESVALIFSPVALALRWLYVTTCVEEGCTKSSPPRWRGRIQRKRETSMLCGSCKTTWKGAAIYCRRIPGRTTERASRARCGTPSLITGSSIGTLFATVRSMEAAKSTGCGLIPLPWATREPRDQH